MASRILFISTYSELTQMIKDVSKELNIPITIYEGGILKKGHIYAKKMQNEFDVIVSQGGTAAAIKSMVNIPVVDVEINIADLIKALIKAREYGARIGLVSYKNDKLGDLENLKKVLNIDFAVFPYSNGKELKNQIKDAISLGQLTLVGMGSCIVEHSLENKLNSVLIKSDRKAVKQAIINAKHISELGKKEKERAETLKAIIDYSMEGIIALDKDEVIIIFNSFAERILNIKSNRVLGRSISDFITREDFMKLYGGKEGSGDILKISNTQILVNRVPIIVDNEQVGLVITFQEVSKLQQLEHKVRIKLYTKGLFAKYGFNDIVGESKTIKDTIDKAMRFGKTSTTILINGETGSGKELFAQSIHNISPRREGPFVAINCAALPETLLESELFGYEEGAFTGAKRGGKPGLFELAHKGTIFLDEIGEIPLSLQGRLLRILQEREVLRIGGDYILNVDIRVIAATNLDLYQMVQEGKFREDLYFRLNILNLKIPPIRQRKEDVPLLVMKFISIKNREHNKSMIGITEAGMNFLKEYSWPGNVRELENFVEKIVILSDTPIVDEEVISKLLLEHMPSKHIYLVTDAGNEDTIEVKIGDLKDMELQLIQAMNKTVKGDKTLLAQKLGISRTTLWKRLKEGQESI